MYVRTVKYEYVIDMGASQISVTLVVSIVDVVEGGSIHWYHHEETNEINNTRHTAPPSQRSEDQDQVKY